MSEPLSLARKGPDSYHHGDLREALVAAAYAEVDSSGSQDVSLSALAKARGVSQAAPYRHFADREEMLVAVATRAFDRMTVVLQEATVRPGAGSQLSRLAHAYFALGVRHLGLYRLMFVSHLIERAAVGSDLQVAVGASFQKLMMVLGPGPDPAMRQRIALKLWVSLHGVVMLVDQGLLPLKVSRIRAEELVEDIIAEAERAVAALGGVGA